MRRFGAKRARLIFCAAVLGAGCADGDMIYRPAGQLLPQHIRKIAIRPIINETSQIGLQDKLVLRIRDGFLKDGQYMIVPESEADGVVAVTVTRYIHFVTKWDSVLVPTEYRLRILARLQFIDKTSNTILWSEPNFEGVLNHRVETLPGGFTEEEARERIWEILAHQIVRRTVDGFGTITGTSGREVDVRGRPDRPPPELPNRPVNPNPY